MHIIPRKRARESPHIERFKRCTNTNGTQLWTALLAFFLAADNNIFLDESQEDVLMDYIANLSSNLGKIVVFDRIRMYGDTDRGKFYFTRIQDGNEIIAAHQLTNSAAAEAALFCP